MTHFIRFTFLAALLCVPFAGCAPGTSPDALDAPPAANADQPAGEQSDAQPNEPSKGSGTTN